MSASQAPVSSGTHLPLGSEGGLSPNTGDVNATRRHRTNSLQPRIVSAQCGHPVGGPADQRLSGWFSEGFINKDDEMKQWFLNEQGFCRKALRHTLGVQLLRLTEWLSCVCI